VRFRVSLATIAVAVCSVASSAAAERALTFPNSAVSELGQIDKLVVTVACGRVSSLRNIPELHNIHLWYEMPVEHVLEVRPRLGAAGDTVRRWSGVVMVVSESDDCFEVKAEAEGRTGKSRLWTGRELGLKK